MQDFPNHTAAIFWFMGCNMRCLYCHNPELVLGKYKRLGFGEIDNFLNSRKSLLQGIVLSGGECTYSKKFVPFVRYLRHFGYKVKIDTNGSNPHTIESVLKDGLVDYIALDFKGPRNKYKHITKFDGYENFATTLGLILANGVDYEVRTTQHPRLLNDDDIDEMRANLLQIGATRRLMVQEYRYSPAFGELEEDNI